ncbi:YcaO-like family protein [Streptomyces sp. NPDC058989]|uniref:YcaO-like family protein n=1 Tax=Streptomyces sp. NPDC058989 TaxID=3346686 RepID=UPI00369D5182
MGVHPCWRRHAHIEGVVCLWECSLADNTGAPVPGASGIGKGHDQAEARLRSLTEALERFLTGPARLNESPVHFVGAGELAAGPLSRDASAPLLTRLSGSELACHSYQSLHPGDSAISIPLYFSAPWYTDQDGKRYRDRVGDRTDYRDLSRYSVSSGYGLAPTPDHATVHALLETIERDACSLLILRVLLSGRPPTVVDPRTLPDDLVILHGQVEHEADGPVHLIDATSDLDIPTILAYRAPAEGRPYLRGQATSLSPTQAVTGALTELLESAVARRHTSPPPLPLTDLEPYPALHRCARFDLTAALHRARTTAFADRTTFPPCPGAQLDEVLSRLTAHGFTAYRRRIATLPGNVSAVHTVVPGLERFFAVVKGALTLPGPRGRSSR